VPALPEPPDSLADDALELDPSAPLDDVDSAFGFDPELDDRVELERRSTLAQPEPLNTIVGGERAFRIEPSVPQSGQNFGPASLIPWTTSVTWPQAVHE